MTKIVFSIPVHEKLDVIKNQIENFTYFNPNCLIIIHVSVLLEIDLSVIKRELEVYKNVLVNNRRILSGHSDTSQAYMHYLNLKFIIDNNISFDYFAINASNDMFVAKGLEEYIINYDGLSYFNEIPENTDWYHGRMGWKDKRLTKIRKELNIDKVYCSQVEGISFNAEIAHKIYQLLDKNIGKDKFYSWTKYLKKAGFKISKYAHLLQIIYGKLYYPTEEFFFTTPLKALAGKVNSPYVYINWKSNLEITKEDIDNIIGCHQLPVPENSKLWNQFFAVKRINRDMNDPVRQYISSSIMK